LDADGGSIFNADLHAVKIDWQKIGIKQLAALVSEKLREGGIMAAFL
jgi:hypothetical protein